MLSVCWLVVGTAMLGVAIWLGWTRWSVLLNGHPAMLATAIILGFLGVVAVFWAIGSLTVGERYDTYVDDDEADVPRRRTVAQQRRRAAVRIALGVPALILCTALTIGLAWARPIPAAPVALAAMKSGNDIQVTDKLTWYEMKKVTQNDKGAIIQPTVGLVFVPGTRIDPRAYANILRPVAEAGYLVAVVKPAYGLALPNSTQPDSVIKNHPEIRYWAVGGQSLGQDLRVGLRRLQSQWQRTQTTQHQIGLHRARRRTVQPPDAVEPRTQVRVATDQQTEQRVGMAGEELGA